MTSSGKERREHSDSCGILAAMRTVESQWDGGQPPRGGPVGPASYAASKVPLITAYFWIIKLLSTAMGEATSDYMVRTINPVIAVWIGFAGFVVAMVLQFRAKAYNAWIYWLAVVMVAVFGTQAADVLHIKFGVPYVASTAFYAIVLVVIFTLWYRTEGTLSIHSIRTPRREAFYWATVLATFAMGTATGDLTAKTLGLGYLASGIWFSVAFAAVAVAHWKFHLNPILAFWIAYVLTRPVGASFADYIAFPRSVGGLGVGHGPVALVLTVTIVILVAYLAVTRKDVETHGRRRPRPCGRHRGAGYQRPGYPPASQPCHRAPRGRTRPCSTPGSTRRSGTPASGIKGSVIQGGSTRRSTTGVQSRGQRYPGEPDPAEQYPGQPHPAPPRPMPPPPPQRPRKPRPAQEQPSRPSRQQPEPWPDEDEADHTAWGFFMWDE